MKSNKFIVFTWVAVIFFHELEYQNYIQNICLFFTLFCNRCFLSAIHIKIYVYKGFSATSEKDPAPNDSTNLKPIYGYNPFAEDTPPSG